MNNLKRNFIISATGFLIIFVGLFVLGSLYDYQVSEFFARPGLEDGHYYTTNGYALFIEATGFAFIYFFSGVAAIIGLTRSIKMKENDAFFFIKELKGAWYKVIKAVLIIGFAIFAVIEFRYMFHEYFDYPSRFLQEEVYLKDGVITAQHAVNVVLSTVLEFVFAILPGSILTFLGLKFIDKETNTKLLYVALIIVVCLLVYLLVIENIKPSVGRARYRTLILLEDSSLYTPWWSGQGKVYLDWNKNIVSSCESSERYLLLGDYFKSFPSGHSYAASISFVLVCLPDIIESFNKNRLLKTLCYVIPFVLTIMVCMGRIVAGAHYLSDVLIGATIPFLIIMLLREILILKGTHFKALFADRKN